MGISTETLSILLVEDNDTHALIVRRHLEKAATDARVRHVKTLSEALERITTGRFDAVLLDLSLPDSDMTETLSRMIDSCHDVPIIALTSLNDLDFATSAVQQGAQDYLVKSDLNGELLLRSIRYAIERKKTQDKLESYAAELERSNEQLKNFAHTVAHEVKSPLTPIKGCIDVLKASFEDQFDDDIAELVESSIVAISGMTDLVNELLEFAHADTCERETTNVDLEALFYQAYVLLRPSIQKAQAEVTHDALPTVQGSEVQLRQLFQNLIGNAIKYCSDAPPRVHVSVEELNDAWRFSVKDNGLGIDDADLERIFEVFVRLPKTSDRPGTGIGLGFCKRIVEIHGGRIWAESTVNEGSTFFVELPKNQDNSPS